MEAIGFYREDLSFLLTTGSTTQEKIDQAIAEGRIYPLEEN